MRLFAAAVLMVPCLGGSDSVALSWRPRIFQYDNFLSDSECEYLKSQATKSDQFDDAASFNSVYFGFTETFQDKKLWDIEERMAVVTGSPPHRGEETMNIHRILKSDAEDGIDEIHHDKVSKEYSSVTVLTYLSEVEKGGETIWPCPATVGGTPLASSCEKAFNVGARWFNGEKTVIKGKMGHQTIKTAAHDDLTRIRDSTSRVCKGESDDGEGFVIVGPKKGSAVVFFHDHTNAEPDPLAWHTGCRVRSGIKWTMQKFKEMPQGWRQPIEDREKKQKLLDELIAKQKKQEL